MIGWLLLGILIGFVLGAAVLLAVTSRRPERAQRALESERASLQKDVALKKERILEMENELRERERKVDALHDDVGRAREEIRALTTLLETERTASAEKMQLLATAEERMREAFQALSAQALKGNNEAFLQLARETLERFQQGAQDDLSERQKSIETLLEPMAKSIEMVGESLRSIETERAETYGTLAERLREVSETQERLRSQTGSLVTALRQPGVRGKWGEITLRRVVELTGMIEHVDFGEQASLPSPDGNTIRPDMVVHLPGEKTIAVDSKAPEVEALYAASSDAATDEEREAALARCAAKLKERVLNLGSKSYQERLAQSPEFVVLFLPLESLFSGALRHDPTLIEFGMQNKVVLASPTTLISLLWAVANGWRQERLSANLQKVAEMSRDLYERIRVMGGHFDDLQRSLLNAVNAYNSAVGSLESRVLVQARKFKELGIQAPKEIEPLKAVEATPRVAVAEDLLRLPFDEPSLAPSKKAR